MDTAVDEGVDAGKLAEQLLGYFRDLMAVTVGCDASMLGTHPHPCIAARLGRAVGPSDRLSRSRPD